MLLKGGELLRGKVGQNSRQFWRLLNLFYEQNTHAREDIFRSTGVSTPLDSKYVNNIYVAFLVREL